MYRGTAIHRAGVRGGIPGEALPLPSAINVAATSIHVSPIERSRGHRSRDDVALQLGWDREG